MSKNYDEMTQRANGLQEHLAGGVSAQVVYSGHRDKAGEYSPPPRQSRSDVGIFPPPAVPSHPADYASFDRGVQYGRGRNDVTGEVGGPGWDAEHLSAGSHDNRAGYGRIAGLTKELDYVGLQDFSYKPPPSPEREWKHGEPPVPQFGFEDRGRAGMYPHRDSDVTTFPRRELHNCRARGDDADMNMPRGSTDVMDPRAYDRRREKITHPPEQWSADSPERSPDKSYSRGTGGAFGAAPGSQAAVGTAVGAMDSGTVPLHRLLAQRSSGMAPQLHL